MPLLLAGPRERQGFTIHFPIHLKSALSACKLGIFSWTY